LTRSIQTGEPYEVEHHLRRADGVYRWFHARGLALRDKEGRIVRWYYLLTDVDDRRRAEEALRKSEALLHEAQRLARTGSCRGTSYQKSRGLTGKRSNLRLSAE